MPAMNRAKAMTSTMMPRSPLYNQICQAVSYVSSSQFLFLLEGTDARSITTLRARRYCEKTTR